MCLILCQKNNFADIELAIYNLSRTGNYIPHVTLCNNDVYSLFMILGFLVETKSLFVALVFNQKFV